MRVALLIDHLGPGGAQKQMALLADALGQQGIKLTVYTYAPGRHWATTARVISGARVDGLLGRRLAQMYVLLRIILWRPTVLVTFLEGPMRLGLWLHRLLRSVRLVVSERNSGAMSRPVPRWQDQGWNAADVIVTNSALRRSELLRDRPHLASRVWMIRNLLGRDGQALDAVPPRGAVRVLAVGRLVRQKGPDLLLEALQQAKADGLDFAVRWVGAEFLSGAVGEGGMTRQALQGQATQRGVSVQFVGPEDRPFAGFGLGDVFVLPSRHEGTPNVMLEAMVRGMVVVATTVGEVPAYIEDGISGLLCSPTAASIAQGLARAASVGAHGREQMGRAARGRVLLLADDQETVSDWLRCLLPARGAGA